MTPRVDFQSRRAVGALLITSALLAAAVTLPAQTPTLDRRWQGWIGCWQPVTDAVPRPSSDYQSPAERAALPRGLDLIGTPATTNTAAAPALPVLCVVPATGRSDVDVVTIADGKITLRERVNPNGERVPVDKDGCTGWQRSQWSADERRIYISSELGCGPGLTRAMTGILSMSQGGEWLDVQGLSAGGNAVVRIARYRDVGIAGVPEEIARVVAVSQLAARAARAAAGAPLGTQAVLDAAKQVDTSVVQSWLVERGQHFDLDGNTLIALADAGLPGSVTDIMIAVSHPNEFIVQQPGGGAPMEQLLTSGDSARVASRYLRDRGCNSLDVGMSPFGSGYGSDPYPSSYGCSRFGYSRYSYSSYGYSPYGYGYSPYGYGYGYNGLYGGYYSGPVVIVRGDAEAQHGKVVNGRGYTRPSSSGSSSGSSSAGSRTSGGSGSSSSGSSGSSGSSSAGSSSAGSSSSGRTAHPRPPTA